MRNHFDLLRRARGLVAGALLVPIVACGGSGDDASPDAAAPPPGPAVKLKDGGDLGNYLVDGIGRSLYAFGRDLPASGGAAATTACTDACAIAWPAFHASNADVGPGLAASDFGELVRPDGGTQTTYKGWPLYYNRDDRYPGQLGGDGMDTLWFVLRDPFYTLVAMGTDDVPLHYLADPQGRTLYMFDDDTVGAGGSAPQSACNDACATTWLPYTGEGEVVPTGVDAVVTHFERADHTMQAAWAGHPLYRYSGDAARGDLRGNNLAGAWHTVDPTAAP